MRAFLGAALAGASLAFVASCSSGLSPTTGSWQPGTPGNPTTSQVSLAAGLAELQPAGTDTLSGAVNAGRFGVTRFDRVYELETPAGVDFAFSVVARGLGNAGLTRVSMGHVDDGNGVPNGGAETIAAAGMMLDGAGLSYGGLMLDATGDGFTRLTVRGNVNAAQVLLLQVPTPSGVINVGVRLRLGNNSAINLAAGAASGSRPGVTETTIYSSESFQFCLPAVAVSGDRYSVVCYDGDPGTPQYGQRTRRWLQMDAQTGTVTGGGEDSYAPDFGSWRDQEIAALGNVLGVVYTGDGQVQAEISLDRGASFPVVADLEGSQTWGQRLVQAAIAPDYTFACLYWRTMGGASGPSTELVLVEATPTGFDANQTPLGYTFGAGQVLCSPGEDVTPQLMHLCYSSAGDLVVGYGYTELVPIPGTWNMRSSAIFRCAARLQGGLFSDVLVDREDDVVPFDPHVCVLGSGSTMEVFYAYEKSDGAYLAYSSDAAGHFTPAQAVTVPGAQMPSVHARMQNGQKRVDLLYQSPTAWGLELHNLQWDNFGSGAPSAYRLSVATCTPGTTTPPAGMPQGYRCTAAAWFGYDAVVDGDDVVVVLHQMSWESYDYYYLGAPAPGAAGPAYSGALPPPPTLLPGMTNPVAAPDPAHRNQLKVLKLD